MLNILLVGNYLETLGLYSLLIGTLMEGVTGGLFSLSTASFAYITDCTTPAQRYNSIHTLFTAPQFLLIFP